MLPSLDPSALQAFLADPARPAATLRYHALQGFLFTVASAPELILPSEWQPIIFGDQEVEYASLDEAQEILGRSNATALAERDAEAPELARTTKVGRNEPCPCGSGKKYKKCCGATVH